MSIIFLAFLLGVLSGLRAFMSLVAVTWAVRFHRLELAETRLAFLDYWLAFFVATALGLMEFVTDQLPSTPSRKVPQQFIPRLLLGGLAGAAIGLAYGHITAALLFSLVGVVFGTYGGSAMRSRLAGAFKSDRPAAYLEDCLAIAIAAFIVISL